MSPVFSKIAKVALIFSAILLALILAFGVVMILGWPWWVGFFILTGLVGVWLAVVFLKKILIRRNEEHFVHQVIEQDNSYLQGLADKEKETSEDLQARWKEAIAALKSSHLKKKGNPLYVLPWYMVIGESGTGKTTAIKSARLSSPFTEIKKTSGISGTRNCDWWFFEQAVILDTAGRYAIPIDEGRDKDEWEKFLALLIKFRKREPINGLVVTVGADKLLQATSEVLEEDGKNIRRRIDQLMRVLGAKFPVYVLVTKCDQIQGMTQFCDRLPEKTLDQAMGMINQTLSTDISAFMTQTTSTIGERLRDLRLMLFHRTGSVASGKGVDPGLLLFPEEFERLKTGLYSFIKGAFQENPYQESPIFRGLFYSSGRQEGRAYSHFLRALGLIDDRDVLPGTNKGLFLHDFFSRILPKDRELFVPTQRSIQWNRLSKSMGLTSWIAIVTALCGLLSFSFVKNLKTLRVVSEEFSKPRMTQGEVLSDAAAMERFRQAILQVEAQNKSWWIPRFVLNESINVERGLKERYCRHFRDGFLLPFDNQLQDRVSRFSATTEKDDIIAHVIYLIRRIKVLRAGIDGEEYDNLKPMPQPSYGPPVMISDRQNASELFPLFEDLYLCYLTWAQDDSILNQEMNDLQKALRFILTSNALNLQWLIAWANQDPSLSSVTLKTFMPEGEFGSEKAIVPAAFTIAGNEQIDMFIREIESALGDPLVFTEKKSEFYNFYRKAYVSAWYEFGTVFPQGIQGVKGRQGMRQLLSVTGTDKDPFLLLLDRMAKELKPFASPDSMPGWMRLVYDFDDAMTLSKGMDIGDSKGGIIAKATDKSKAIFSKLEKKTDGLSAGKDLDAALVSAKAVKAYVEALSELPSSTVSRAVAYQAAKDTFECQDPISNNVAFYQAKNALERFKATVSATDPTEKMFWPLLSTPIDCFLTFIIKEASCQLQDMWQNDILVEIQGISDTQRANMVLFGEDGLAIKFIKGPASAFIGRDLARGYYPKAVQGKSLPVNTEFLKFTTKGAAIKTGAIQGSQPVLISGLPTDTNFDPSYDGPRLGVESTTLEMQCATDTVSIVNYNFPVKKTFDWKPGDCSEVILTINVGKTSLIRKYSGSDAFPKFLRDFPGGERVFYARDFPYEEPALKRMGIKSIKVKYRFSGHEQVMRSISQTPGGAPRAIAECWD
ncbi:Type VI secretion system ATPase and inner membrane protein TssM [uncultured Desulfobacterium sp.]|uniref:Type VI secretion system ATPase and inner membrane protein TssM n=1 Tax=uncultured Desulfobacterium sp. TaxID=201089 RepID=A0A445N1X7_9BACT|nr:Type VI secretion system ATPase and inner membrane protein TssM [uncultured Desulfobacterium sp.]